MYKALIIDDERPVRIAISKLGDWNHFHIEMPEMAENGKDALEKMQSGNYDICFVDMQMPVMNGSMFLQECAREFPDTGVIVISGYDDFSYVQNAIRCGAVDYLLKPIVKSELDLAIEKAIRKAFEIQKQGLGFTFIEVVASCPTNWGLTPVKAMEFVREKMIPYYPLGVYKDITVEEGK